MEEATPRSASLSYSSAASPEHMSRIDQAIQRYEDEIQNICRSNAQLRASIQSKSNSQPRSDISDSFRYDPPDVQKLQRRIKGLEDYIQTLEERAKGSPRSKTANDSDEIQALRRTVTALSEQNEALRAQVESLSVALKIAEQRLQRPTVEQASYSSREPKLQDVSAALKAELAREKKEKEQLAAQYSFLESKGQKLDEEFEAMRRSQGGKSMLESASSEELSRYKAMAQEQEHGKAQVEKRLQEFIRESEQMQEDLKNRIQILESRQQLRSTEDKHHTSSSKRVKSRRDLNPPSRDSRSKSASRKHSKSPHPDDTVHYSCPKCIRKHSKEHLRKSISP